MLCAFSVPAACVLLYIESMYVADLMTTDVWTLGPDATIADAAAMMWEHGIGCIPITDDDRYLLGVVTDRDLCLAAYGRELPMTKLPIADAMTGLVYTVSPDARVADADALMRKYRVRRVPVTDRLGRLIGIVCLTDIARAALRRAPSGGVDVARTLVGICEPLESVWTLRGWG
jgi:CBS domain-containing protein